MLDLWSVYLVYTLFISLIIALNGETLSVLSPAPGQILVTDIVLVLVQIGERDIQLGKDGWVLCINSNFDSTGGCWDSYASSSIGASNNTFAQILPLPENALSGDYQIQVVLGKIDSNQHLMPGTHEVLVNFSLERVKYADNTVPIASVNTLADATFLAANTFDVLRMRLREHQPDQMLLIDTNESHNGLMDKEYVFQSTVVSNADPLHNHATEVFHINRTQFTNRTSIDTRGFTHTINAQCVDLCQDNDLHGAGGDVDSTRSSIYVVHPPSEPDVDLREPLHRDSVADLLIHTERQGPSHHSLSDMYIVSDTDEIIHRRAIGVLRVSRFAP